MEDASVHGDQYQFSSYTSSNETSPQTASTKTPKAGAETPTPTSSNSKSSWGNGQLFVGAAGEGGILSNNTTVRTRVNTAATFATAITTTTTSSSSTSSTSDFNPFKGNSNQGKGSGGKGLNGAAQERISVPAGNGADISPSSTLKNSNYGDDEGNSMGGTQWPPKTIRDSYARGSVSTGNGGKQRTCGGKTWSTTARVITFPIPDFLLTAVGMRTPLRRNAWREKCLIVFLVLLFSGWGFVMVHIVGRKVCGEARDGSRLLEKVALNSLNRHMTLDEVPRDSPFIAVNGRFINTALLPTALKSELEPYNGADLSAAFPTFFLLAGAQPGSESLDADIRELVPNATIADAWREKLLTDLKDQYAISPLNNKLEKCPRPRGESG
ncbi:hypothetical protein HK102_010425, partial [Quaeritorhiza haematococci]